MLECDNCERKIAGNLVQCFIHDGNFCERCEDCGDHARDEDSERKPEP